MATLLLVGVCTAAVAENNGTLTIQNATIGRTYTVYKVFDATYSGTNISYTYTKTADTVAFYTALTEGNSPFVLTATVVENVYNVTIKADATAETISSWLTGHINLLTQTAAQEATSSTVVFNNLPYGYYYVTSSLGSTVSVDTVTPRVTIIDKNQEPDWNDKGKYIDVDGVRVYINSANIGETLNFVVPVDATNGVGDKLATSYIIDDTLPTGITFNNDLKVYIDGVELVIDEDPETPDPYSVVYGNGFTFKVTIPWAAKDTDGYWHPIYADPSSHLIEIKYTGTVNEQIGIDTDNVNTAHFSYTLVDPTDPEDEPVEPEGEKPTSSTDTFSTQFTINKVDSEGNALTGAKFNLSGISIGIIFVNQEMYVPVQDDYEPQEGEQFYYMLRDGSYTTTSPYEENVNLESYDVENPYQKYIKINTVTQQTTSTPINVDAYVGADGKITFKGLGVGIYTLTELIAPNGYNLLNAPIEIQISFDTETKTFNFEYRNQGADEDAWQNFNATMGLNIVNSTGSELPSTGGIGTTIFYIVGGVLMVAAVVLFATKKRMSASKN